MPRDCAHVKRPQPIPQEDALARTKPPRSQLRGSRTCRALHLRDVFCLEALGALADLKLHKLAFVQRFIPIHLDGREVNEDVFSRLSLNEPVPLRRVEPLHHTLFSSQRCLPLASGIPTQVIATPVAYAARGIALGWRPHKRRCRAPISGGILAQTEFGCPEDETWRKPGN
jgi:hypothetical protein